MNDKVINVFLDVGNYSIKALAGMYYNDYSKVKVIGYAEELSSGIKKSKIIDIDLLSGSIKKAINKLQKQINESYDFEINKIYLLLGGPYTVSENIFNSYRFSDERRIITEEDLKNFFKNGINKIFNEKEKNEHRVIFNETYNLKIDDNNIFVKNPVGKEGYQISANVNYIYISEYELEKYNSAINKLGIEIEDIYINVFMSALGCIYKNEAKDGVVVLDFGYGMTELCLVKNEKLIVKRSKPIGEMHFISDIHYGMDVDMDTAKNIYEKYKQSYKDNEEFIRYENKKIDKKEIKNFIDQRLEADIAKFINDFLLEYNFKNSRTDEVYTDILITGGGNELYGLIDTLSDLTNCKFVNRDPFKIRGLHQPKDYMSSVIGAFNYNIQKVDMKIQEEKIKIEELQNKGLVQDASNDDKITEMQDNTQIEVEEEKDGIFIKIKNFFLG